MRFTLGLLALAGCSGVIDRGVPEAPAAPQAPSPEAGGTGGGSLTTAADQGGAPGAVTKPRPVCAAPPRVVRLTDDAYAQAIVDLLPGVKVEGIKTPGAGQNEGAPDALGVDGRLVSQLHQSAGAIGQQVAREPQRAVTCKAGQDERACAGGFIDRFVARAFRRPLAADERQRLLALYDLGRVESFGAGLGVVVQATLQSADFLYRTELGAGDASGGTRRLSPYEQAAALSFFLLNSVPDDELWQAASSGALSSPRELEAQASRLLALPRVRETLVGVLARSFGLHRVLAAEAATVGFDQAMRKSMHDEASRFLHSLVSNGGTIEDLFTSRQTSGDARMAQIFGTAIDASMLAPDRWSGILTRPGFVAGLPSGNRSVFRGLIIRSRVLCTHLPPPPGDLDASALARLASARNEREKVGVRAGTPACAGCHALMDPLGLSLEHYDEIGRYVTTREGGPVDASGTLAGTDVDGPFRNAVELSDRLGGSAVVAACLLSQIRTAATGRREDEAAGCQGPAASANLALTAAFRAIATGPLVRDRSLTGDAP